MNRLRDWVELQSVTETNTSEGPSFEYARVWENWGRFRPMTAERLVTYGQIGVANVTHDLLLKGQVGVTMEGFRFVWRSNGNKVLEIVAPAFDPDGTGEWTTVLVRDTGETDA